MADSFAGDALKYNGTSWSSSHIDKHLLSVSCSSSTFCVATGIQGHALTYNGTDWSSPTDIDGSKYVTDASCTSAAFCAAVDNDGGALLYLAPGVEAGSVWTLSINENVGCFEKQTFDAGNTWSADQNGDVGSYTDGSGAKIDKIKETWTGGEDVGATFSGKWSPALGAYSGNIIFPDGGGIYAATLVEGSSSPC
jgi:hypothetical protein